MKILHFPIFWFFNNFLKFLSNCAADVIHNVPVVAILALVESAEEKGVTHLFHPPVNHHYLNASAKGYMGLKDIVRQACENSGNGPEHANMRCVLYEIIETRETKENGKVTGGSKVALEQKEKDPKSRCCNLKSMSRGKRLKNALADIANETKVDVFLQKIKEFDYSQFTKDDMKTYREFKEMMRKHFGTFRLGFIDGLHRINALLGVVSGSAKPFKLFFNFTCSINITVMKSGTDASIEEFLHACWNHSLEVKDALKKGVDHTIHDALAAVTNSIITRNQYLFSGRENLFHSLKTPSKATDILASKAFDNKTDEILENFAKECHEALLNVPEYKDIFNPKQDHLEFISEGYAKGYFKPCGLPDANSYIIKKQVVTNSTQLKTATNLKHGNNAMLRLLESALMSKKVASRLLEAFRDICEKSPGGETSYDFFMTLQYHAARIASVYYDKMATEEQSNLKVLKNSGAKWKTKRIRRFLENQVQTDFVEGVSYWYNLDTEARNRIAKAILGDGGKSVKVATKDSNLFWKYQFFVICRIFKSHRD
mgnify:CR=1 FL=1